MTPFLILTSKICWRQQKVQDQNQFLLQNSTSSIKYLSNKGSTVFIRQLEQKLSSFEKCRIFVTSSSKYDVTTSLRRIFWRQSKVYLTIIIRAKFHLSSSSLRVFSQVGAESAPPPMRLMVKNTPWLIGLRQGISWDDFWKLSGKIGGTWLVLSLG